MRITIDCETFVAKLQQVCGVIPRRNTLPILGNALLRVSHGRAAELLGGDTEIQVSVACPLESDGEGAIAFPGRKVLDLIRVAPAGATIVMSENGGRLTLQMGKSRFVVGTLPAAQYPDFLAGNAADVFSVAADQLKVGIERTVFCVANQDFRTYLNGVLLEIGQQGFRLVASDSHRLALYDQAPDTNWSADRQVIIPKKGATEIARLLTEQGGKAVDVSINPQAIWITGEGFEIVAKLIDSQFPDYRKLLPSACSTVALTARDSLKSAITRVLVLSNERHHGVQIAFGDAFMTLHAQNADDESAEDAVSIAFNGESFVTAFNGNYIGEILSNIEGEQVKLGFSDTAGACLISSGLGTGPQYVVSPMRM